jgi:hypothetical protein
LASTVAPTGATVLAKPLTVERLLDLVHGACGKS